jgi:hypothetical protein
MNRRTFIKSVFKVAGVAGLVRMGLLQEAIAGNVITMFGSGGGSPSPDYYTDDFTDATHWTELGPSGRWSISSGEYVATSNAANQAVSSSYSTQLANSAVQAAKVQIVAAESYPNITFRRTGTPGDIYYAVQAKMGTTTTYWSHYTDDADLSPSADYETLLVGSTWANGNWIGAEFNGVGSSTVVYVWRWTSDPGEWDAAHTNWGAPADTSTVDPTSIGACDTGKYAGIGAFIVNSPETATFDNYSVWSSS